MHFANTWVYKGVLILNGESGFYSSIFLSGPNCYDCVRMGGKNIYFGKLWTSSLIFVLWGFLRQKERKAMGWRAPGCRTHLPSLLPHLPSGNVHLQAGFTAGYCASDPSPFPREDLRLTLDFCSPPTLQQAAPAEWVFFLLSSPLPAPK